MRVLIVTGGRVEDDFARIYLQKRRYDRVIAADAGLSHCARLGIRPTDVLGDFDSLSDPELLARCREEGIPVRTFPARKDYTDTHLALLLAEEAGADEVTILGATGGNRLDHLLGNLCLLKQAVEHRVTCKLVDAHNEIEMLEGPCARTYRRDENYPYFSVVAWSPRVAGLTLTGFAYPLEDAALTYLESLGVSNRITEETAWLTLKAGDLLVIRARD